MTGSQPVQGVSPPDRAIDFELLRRYREYHDEGAFTDLYCRRAPEMRRRAMRWLQDPELAEDAVGDMFVALREAFDPDLPGSRNASVRTWLFRRLTFKLIDCLRARGRLPELLALKEEFEVDGLYGSVDEDHVGRLAASDFVNNILDAVPPQHPE